MYFICVISVTKCVQRLKLSVSYPVEFVIHYNLIRYAAVITFYVTIVIIMYNYALCNKYLASCN